MSESFLNGKVTLHRGDCLEVLPLLEENSIDSCVTDPPYHLTSIVKRFGSATEDDVYKNAELRKTFNQGKSPHARAARGFMGKQWDGGDIAFRPELWAEVLRVLKPGAHLLAFSGTRTYHRMACAIEDAGFEIRDQIGWCYGSGFPKSHNVGLAIDKLNGAAPRGKAFNYKGRGERAEEFDENGREFLPPYEANNEWGGWGTALKPAWEPICLARKPLSESSIAANVLKHGTGGINVGGCRVETAENLSGGAYAAEAQKRSDAWVTTRKGDENCLRNGAAGEYKQPQGRWPANLIHDGSEEVLAGFPETQSGGFPERHGIKEAGCLGAFNGRDTGREGDCRSNGSAARFFYTAKADKFDRIARFVEDVRIEWISDQGPRQVTLQVDTEQSPEKAIVASGSDTSKEWSMFLSGKRLTALFQQAYSCTTVTGTNSTTDSPTWSLLTLSLTNGFTGDVRCETGNGGNLAESVANGTRFLIITLARTASLPGANHAIGRTQLTISVSARRSHGHPTCKPLDLMQYLVRLVTPRGGVCLDPFSGTGTTGEAAWREGFRAILVEREEEYQADIVRRMGLCLAGPDERRAASVKQESHSSLPLFGGEAA